MKYEMYSYAHKNLCKEIPIYQKKVFDRFGYNLNQLISELNHGESLEYIIKTSTSDYIIIFDVDCIPLTNNLVQYIEKDLNEYDLIGATGCANHLKKDDIYIHPSFMFFKKQLYFDCDLPKLYEDENNDVAQNFTRVCIQKNKKIKFWRNLYSDDYLWDLPNKPKFGHGTVYENLIYHQFEIRKSEQHVSFINKCKSLLNYEL
jgi:hypothetical protein